MKNENYYLERLDQQVETVEGVKWKKPVIDFPQYELLLERANEVSDYLSTIEVTEENLKESKKIIAEAKKITKALSDKRIAIKKDITSPVIEFENKIKEISAVIDQADALVRTQVDELEQKQRDEKEIQLKSIFEERVTDYTVGALDKEAAWEHWIEPQYLNKTVSIKAAEQSMVDFLEKTETDTEAIKTMENREELLIEYIKTFDIAQSIAEVNKTKAIKDAIKTNVLTEPEEQRAMIVIRGEKDIKLAKALLKENKIDYYEIES